MKIGKITEDRAVRAAADGYAALARGRPASGFVACTRSFPAGAAGLEARMRREMGYAGWTGWSFPIPSRSGTSKFTYPFRRFWLDRRIALHRHRAKRRFQKIKRAVGRGAGDAVWLGLIAPDGQIRDLALRMATGPLPSAFVAGAIVRRVNDWVPEVRAAARGHVPALLAASPTDIAGPALVLALRQDRAGRGWGRAEDGAVAVLLRDRRNLDAVLSYLTMSSAGSGPSVLPGILRAGHGDGALHRLATTAVQPGVRAVAVRALVAGEARWSEGRRWQWIDKPMGIRRRVPAFGTRPLTVPKIDRAEILTFARDPSARVRRAVLDGLDDTRPEGLVSVAAVLRDDPWPSIRHRADVLLR